MVAELKRVCWLDVDGTVKSGELQANTMYVAYLIYTVLPHSSGFDTVYQESMVKIPDEVICHEILYLKCRQTRELISNVDEPQLKPKYFPKLRNDRWMEIGLGEFLNEYGVEEEIKIVFREIKNLHWKRGLVIEGIEFRPKQ
ncbi:hypothetical protein ZOSMA_24G01000 [Zostera marina]|uniref:Uncharacterized protein n=1 Tax=Zostera marina TaxID=29655 RepID=A0A0K9PIL9_ZOSMR|nr:hypothetical protein ZOSMA_24G01000 [Zostera marina]